MTTAAGNRAAWVKPFFIGVLGFVVAAAVAAAIAALALSRDQGSAYCEAIEDGIRQAEAQGAPLEPHAERLRQQYDEDC